MIARIDGLNIHGGALDVPETKWRAEFEGGAKTEMKLSQPFHETKVTIPIRDGVVREIAVGTAVQAFQTFLGKKRTELQDLLGQVTDIDVEIQKAKAEVVKTERREVKKANEEREVELDALLEEVESSKQQTIEEIQTTQNEEAAASKAHRQKLAELF